MIETLYSDLRFGIRTLLRNPAMAAAAVVALALGIGANSAIFSVVYAVLLRPVPVRNADRLVTIVQTSKKLNVTGAQPGFSLFAAWREHLDCFEAIAAASSGTAAVSAGGPDETMKFWRVSAGFLPTLGVAPALGRNFTAEEDQPGRPPVALVAYGFWQARLNAHPQPLGTVVKIDGIPHTVIGVLPAGFHVDGRPADVYAPIAKSANSREWLPVNIYARLKPGIGLDLAQKQLDAYSGRMDRGPLGWEPRIWPLREYQVRNVRASLWVLLGAVGLVLLIACSNTATLLLARARARSREIAVRSALGAGRKRIVRQLLTESVVLAVAGGACGVLVAAGCIRLLPLITHASLPGLLEQTRIDTGVLAFTMAVSLLTGLLFGSAPALSLSRADVIETLKEGGRAGAGAGRKRAWNFLIVAETGLAVVLAIGAALLIRTFFYLRDVAPGFDVDHLLTARITPPQSKFTSSQQALAYWSSVMDQVRRIPGVRSASFAQALPLTGDNWVMSWPVEGHPFGPRPQDLPTMNRRNVDTEYFRTMQIPLKAGRFFNDADNANAPKVVIVNEAFVRRFWPGQNALGKHLGGSHGLPPHEVVGIAADVRSEDSMKAALPEVYLHVPQFTPARVALAIRADAAVYKSALALEPAIRQAVAAADPAQAVTQFAEMRRLISDRIAPKRMSAQLIAVFAGLALVLAAVGIYGVLSFSVAQRTHEIGVRVALGAGRGEVIGMILRQACGLAIAGIGLGVAAAFALTRVVKSILFGVSPADPLAYAGSAAVLLAVAACAALVPALRAAGVEPVIALRHE